VIPQAGAVVARWYEGAMSWLRDLLAKRKPAAPNEEDPGGDGYAFRLRLLLPERRSITTDASELRLSPVEDVRLVALGGVEQLSKAKKVALIGRGYRSEEAAREGARRWRGRLERSLAFMQFGVDFGDRAPSGGLGSIYQTQLEAEHGRPILYDDHGALVFKETPWPRFVRIDLDLATGAPVDILTAATEKARQLDLTMPEREVLAYDLFAASFFQIGSDARYLMLMTALEALIDPQARPRSSVEHVERLIKLTRDSDLSEDEISSMVGSLRRLQDESIGQAGRRLSERLGDRRYKDGTETAAQFFSRCYTLRSNLVHGHIPRPAEGEIGLRAANLEVFLGHLLSGDLLDALDIDAIVAARNRNA
jgi:hypothetical protein